jgi:hypothetical protein
MNMRLILVKWVGPILLGWGCLCSEVHAQSDSARHGPSWWTGRPIEMQKEKEDRVPALQYTLAALMTILVLVIACMPSRKRYEG